MILGFSIPTPEQIFFLYTKPNLVMDGFFTKILFSNSFCSLNGLFIHFPNVPFVSEFDANRGFLRFNIQHNLYKDWFRKMVFLENAILDFYFSTKLIDKNKAKVLKLSSFLASGVFKTFLLHNNNNVENNSLTSLSSNNNNKCRGICKISGVWEDALHFGLTFKVVPLTPYPNLV